MYSLRPLTPLSELESPVLKEEILSYLHVDESEWEDVVKPLLHSAMEACEDRTATALFGRGWELITAAPPVGYLPGAYVVEVISIQAEKEPVSADSYELVGDYIMLNKALPDARYYRVEYVRGFPADQLPESIKQALKVIVTDWYDNRSDSARSLPTLTDKLLKPFVCLKA